MGRELPDSSVRQLDAEVARLARSAGRRLAFVSAAHYCRERLGLGRSSLEEKRVLAARLSRLPRLGAAALSGTNSVSAALLSTRVATEKTAAAWVARARQRTLKHLREEVAFVEGVLCQLSRHERRPPSAEVMGASLACRATWRVPEPSSGRLSRRTDPRMAAIQAYEEQGNAPAPPIQKSGGESSEFSLVRQRELSQRSAGGGWGGGVAAAVAAESRRRLGRSSLLASSAATSRPWARPTTNR